jgi:hypothetical protein
MQIGAGLRRAHARARAVHPIDLLDASYAALSRRQAEDIGRDSVNSPVRADG